MAIFLENKKIDRVYFEKEVDFEKEVVQNHKTFFGKDSLFIDTKKKLSTNTLGGVIPDGFLIDFRDPEDFKFYIVEIELSKHSFYKHIFPQITKFIAFFRSPDKKRLLTEEIYNLIDNNSVLKQAVTKYIKTQELYKFVTDLIKDSENILIVIDDEKPEFEEILKTYPETWGELTKILVIKKYDNSDRVIFSMEPEFDELDYLPQSENNIVKVGGLSEEGQLDFMKCGVKDLYYKLKESLLTVNPNIVFNPQKYYISIRTNKNHVYLKGRKRWLDLVIMKEEEEILEIIKTCRVRSLSGSVQKFYSGSCASVYLEKEDQIGEIIDCLQSLISK